VSAARVSSLVQDSVDPKTRGTYTSGFRSLLRFAQPRGLPCLPTDEVTLAAWAESVCPSSLTPDSVVKYCSGIRKYHIESGVPWVAAGTLFKMALRALFKRYPRAERGLKVPLTLQLILRLAKSLRGWPVPAAMSWDDLVFVTASAIGFAAALRGGEFLASRGSNRPVLLGKWVVIDPNGVHVAIPKPKTKHQLAFQHSYAGSATGATLLSLDARLWLLTYRSEAIRRGVPTSDEGPAFVRFDGQALSRDFMVGRAMELLKANKVTVLGPNNAPCSVRAASWRCGYVSSALEAGVQEVAIRAQGRWESQGGMLAYSLSELSAVRRAANAIVALAAPSPAGVVGCSSSEQLLLCVR